MAVTRADVVHIAALARLALDESRIPRLVDELNGILAHMDVLSKVDTRKVAAAAAVGDAAMPLREDRGPSVPLSQPLDVIAPSVRDGFLLVPRLSTHEEALE